jgi:uncharacterized protein (TIGR03000 family)
MMLKRYVWGAGVLAVLAVLLLPQVSEAQRRGLFGRNRANYGGWGYGGYGYGGYGGYGYPGYGGYAPGLGYGTTGYGMATYGPALAGTTYGPGTLQSYQSFYPPQGGSADQASTTRILVLVPDPNARVLIDGNQTQQTGTQREYVTDMQPGTSGTYHITVRWTANGQQREEMRDVRVRAGQRQVVDLSQATGTTGSGTRQGARPEGANP